MSLCVHLFTSMLAKRNTRQCINNSVSNKRTKTIVEQYMQHWQLFRQAGDYHNDLESFTNFSQRLFSNTLCGSGNFSDNQKHHIYVTCSEEFH